MAGATVGVGMVQVNKVATDAAGLRAHRELPAGDDHGSSRRQAADAAAGRLRPALRRCEGRRALGHADADPARSEAERDDRAVDPARPAREDPRPRRRQDQRRLRVGRAGPDHAHGQGAAERVRQAVPGQPRDRGRLQGLPRGGRHRPLRLHRRRPPLLPLEPRPAGQPALRGDRRPARLPEAVRAEGARLRALPPPRQRHRPRRPPAGLPPPGERAGEHEQPAEQPPPAGQGLREEHVHRREPADQPGHPAAAAARGLLRRAAGAPGRPSPTPSCTPSPPPTRRRRRDRWARPRPRSGWATT